MKLLCVSAFAALSCAFILPNEQVNDLRHVEKQSRLTGSHIKDDVEKAFHEASDEIVDTYNQFSHNLRESYYHFSHEGQKAANKASSFAKDKVDEARERLHGVYEEYRQIVDEAKDQWHESAELSTLGYGPHGSYGPDGPHHPHDPHKPLNLTVYQLIAGSKYTTKLTKLIDEYPDLVETLNGTSANFTVFAPIDSAFDKIPEHAPKPSKEFLKALLTYHISPEFYPAGHILVSRTVPSLLKSPALGAKPLPQRLSTQIGITGLTVNFYSRVVAVDVFGTNGVVHGLSSILIPPPKILQIVDLLPSEFSTLDLGLVKTGLRDELNDTIPITGGTFFAPSNFAFQKLGPFINAFLFSEHGLKYLKALLQYHFAPLNVLYSDAFYRAGVEDPGMTELMRVKPNGGIPKGIFHTELPTLLHDRSLSIDVARYGRLIEIKINSFYRVSIPDGVAYDGVVHVSQEVIIPPKELADGTLEYYNGSEDLTVESLKERLEPYLELAPSYEEL